MPAQTPAPSTVPPVVPEFREDLLRNAVAFLKHPSVVGTPLARRVAFMKGKGLTSAEIEEALTRAGAAATATSAPLPQPTNVQYVPQPLMQPPPSGMSWSGLALTAILAAGAGVAATYLVKVDLYRSCLFNSVSELRDSMVERTF